MKKNKYIIFFGLALVVVLLDQLTKLLFNTLFSVGHGIQLLPFFGLKLAHNTGAAFSILAGNTVLLMWISVIVIGIILFFIDKLKDKNIELCVALILGGTIGNLIDRLAHGFVIDFIDFSFWPTFNIADSAIFIGAVLLGIYTIRKDMKKEIKNK